MLTWNGVDMSQYFSVNDIRSRSVYTRNLDLISVTNMPGAYLQGITEPPRLLEIDITIRAKNLKELRQKIDEINGIMISKEPVPLSFSDEPDKTYYGMTEAISEDIERDTVHKTTINVLCIDPYKYGPEKVIETESDTFIVENEGTAEAKPIIELTVKEPVTFAMISDGERYNMIGRPVDVEQDIVDEKNVVLDEVGDTIDTWQPAPDYNGTFVHGSQGIQVGNWGSGSGWHGPGAIKEIDPIQDFEIEFFVYVRSETPDRTFAITTNFFDEHMNELGMMRLWDNSGKVLRKVVEARVGPYVGDFVNYLISSRNYDLREQRVWGGIIRVIRKGNTFTFYAARITQAGKHVDTITQTFRDVNNEYGGKLKFVRIDIRNYGNTGKPNEVAINRIRIWEHKEVLADQTPYIAYPGDVITFDHTTNELLLNGEDAKRLKDFGGQYFDLPKGSTTLTVMPDGAFDTTIRFKPKYR